MHNWTIRDDLLGADRSLRTQDRFGRMHVETVNISKANVCPYQGREIPNYKQLGLDASKVYRLWRHPDELAAAAHTFDNLPLLADHIVVTADKPEQESIVGTTGSDTRFEYPYLKTSLAVWTSDAIAKIRRNEKRELSSSYGYAADMTPGVTPEGVAYDGVMRHITGNHVATVREGRAGHDVLVADEKPPEFRLMLRATALAALSAFFKPDVDQVALDVALDAQMAAAELKAASDAKAKADKEAQDASPEDWEDDPEKTGMKRRKAKKVVAKDAAAPVVADKDPNMVTKDEAAKLASDAATAAVAAALNAERALAKARADVLPLVGAVALDSAEAVYRHALTAEKVANAATIHVDALPFMVEQVKAAKIAKVATDSALPLVSTSTRAAVGF